MDKIQTAKHSYWKFLRTTTLLLLIAWFIPTFVVSFFANELTFDFFGWPFSFWMASQGSLLIYLVLVFIYAKLINKLDSEYIDKINKEG